jgi:hypothetical protein
MSKNGSKWDIQFSLSIKRTVLIIIGCKVQEKYRKGGLIIYQKRV